MRLLHDLDEYTFRLNLPRWLSITALFLYPATWAIVSYRFGNWIYRCIKIPVLRQVLFFLYFITKRISEIFTGIEIAHDAQIGKGLFIAHIGGVVIGTKAVIGEHASIHQGVTVGGSGRGENHGSPVIGDYVYFGAGSKIVGRVKIGDWVMIGANAVVVSDISDYGTAVGIPARLVNTHGSWDYIHFRGKGRG